MANDAGPGTLIRTSSQPMSHLPRRAPGRNGSLTQEFTYVPEDKPYSRHSSANLIDLSFDADSTNVERSRAPPNTFRDLITF